MAAPDSSGHRCGFIALVGRPNVGKSTLLNRLVGARVALVTPKPQTTRTRVLGVRTEPAAQFIFIDTPGIHRRQSSLLNRQMVDTALRAPHDADVTLFVVDVGQGLTGADTQIAERLRGTSSRICIGLNKIDLAAKTALIPLLERLSRLLPDRDVVPISARTGENTEELLGTLRRVLPSGPALFAADDLTDQSERVLAQEMVREQLFLQTQQEIPYATAVMVERFEDVPDRPLLRIYASVHVERASQKAVVIGHKGERLKQIGQAARQRLEDFFRCRVYLELFVKVSKGWTNSRGKLREFGLAR